MHRPLLIAIGAVLVFLFIVYLAKCSCGCGCWRWCPCAQNADSACCCKKASESMFPVNLNRQVTLHSVQWCPHCKVMKPIWDQVKVATAGSGITFRELDEDKAKSPGINGYPTIRMVTESGATIDYHGPPNFTTLRNWVVSPAKVID